MRNFKNFLTRALVAGSVASIISAAALALRGRSETGGPYATLNAPSHWIWGERAIWQGAPSLRHTATGVFIHHTSSVFWGVVHEAAHGNAGERALAHHLRDAALTTALAAWVDLRLVPERLTPGFEKRLSMSSLTLVYGLFGLGLALGSLMVNQRRKNLPARK